MQTFPFVEKQKVEFKDLQSLMETKGNYQWEVQVRTEHIRWLNNGKKKRNEKEMKKKKRLYICISCLFTA